MQADCKLNQLALALKARRKSDAKNRENLHVRCREICNLLEQLSLDLHSSVQCVSTLNAVLPADLRLEPLDLANISVACV